MIDLTLKKKKKSNAYIIYNYITIENMPHRPIVAKDDKILYDVSYFQFILIDIVRSRVP